MALDRARLTNNIVVRLRALYNEEDMLLNDRDEEYTIRRWAEIISECIIDEFVGNAQCNGNDSHGDTHNNVGII